MPITNNLGIVPGYEIESVAGTDVATTRVAFPGELVDFRFIPNEPKETSYGPNSYTPTGAYATFFELECEVVLKPYYDNLASSLVALHLGTINAGSGVISVADQRPFTVQGGWDLGTDVYRRMRNCRIKTFRREYAYGEATLDTYRIVGISRPTADTQSTAWAAAPTAAVGSPWVSPGHVTHTFSSGLTFTGAVEKGFIEIDRGSVAVKGLNQTDRAPTSTYTGANLIVRGGVTLLPDDFAPFVAYYTDPQTAGGTFTQTINFTKNANAQYSNWVITKTMFDDADFWHWQRNAQEGLTWDIPWQMGADATAGGTLAVDTVV